MVCGQRHPRMGTTHELAGSGTPDIRRLSGLHAARHDIDYQLLSTNLILRALVRNPAASVLFRGRLIAVEVFIRSQAVQRGVHTSPPSRNCGDRRLQKFRGVGEILALETMKHPPLMRLGGIVGRRPGCCIKENYCHLHMRIDALDLLHQQGKLRNFCGVYVVEAGV